MPREIPRVPKLLAEGHNWDPNLETEMTPAFKCELQKLNHMTLGQVVPSVLASIFSSINTGNNSHIMKLQQELNEINNLHVQKYLARYAILLFFHNVKFFLGSSGKRGYIKAFPNLLPSDGII